jgi:hypothetical protein
VERPVSWSTAEVERRIGRTLAVVMNAGTYPGSMATNDPRSRWRMGVGLSAAVGRSPRERASPASHAPNGERFAAIRVAPARYRIVARVADASRVELAADFTEWKPVAMQHDDDDVWSAELPVLPGVHRVSVRSDGAAWIAPPGLMAQDDGFGGSAGVFVIP